MYSYPGLAEKSFIAKNASVAFDDVRVWFTSVYFSGF